MRSPLFSGLLYFLLGGVFTYFAVQQVILDDWNFFVYLLIILATFDFGAGFRLISIHFKIKKAKK
ncbi:YdiK family protein [Lederbergia lenta]|uniref:Putative lipoprotein n=1 Tax=Lederbergia lenta TaxID=1467 RepID=A0A2X4YY63_LEDLE|nr:YdiK family protein [Lederbergia lenta]MCM3113133.1 YdiK family protein [Lederbergia lenta]MEC2326078.1 YdiK family protein [Lederbergia lenta]SQI53274.1 putative lipoprotein [Lederbergia lenta]